MDKISPLKVDAQMTDSLLFGGSRKKHEIACPEHFQGNAFKKGKSKLR